MYLAHEPTYVFVVSPVPLLDCQQDTCVQLQPVPRCVPCVEVWSAAGTTPRHIRASPLAR